LRFDAKRNRRLSKAVWRAPLRENATPDLDRDIARWESDFEVLRPEARTLRNVQSMWGPDADLSA
jgi:hypothetical protein